VTTGFPDPWAAAGRGHVRASHADREHVIETLKAAFVQGRLTKDEFDTRVSQTFVSRTYAELAELTADIPAGLTAAQPLHKPARRPMNNAAKAGICVSIAAATLVVATLLFGPAAFVMFVVFYFMASLAAVAQMLDSRHQKRSRGQLPPRPGQDGQAFEGRRHSSIGHDLAPPRVGTDETRADLRTHRSRGRSHLAKPGGRLAATRGCSCQAGMVAT